MMALKDLVARPCGCRAAKGKVVSVCKLHADLHDHLNACIDNAMGYALRLRESAAEIDRDGTPSQVGLTPTELLEIARAIEVLGQDPIEDTHGEDDGR